MRWITDEQELVDALVLLVQRSADRLRWIESLPDEESHDAGQAASRLPRAWFPNEVAASFGITGPKIDSLIKAGRVGFILGQNRKRRLMAEHIGQIREAIEVKPAAVIDPGIYARMGVTRQAARRRALRQ